jgi:hypothetical protein
MEDLAKDVYIGVRQIREEYLPNLKKAEAEYFRATGRKMHSPDKYREFHKVLDKYRSPQ